jgi:hypothetical protein
MVSLPYKDEKTEKDGFPFSQHQVPGMILAQAIPLQWQLMGLKCPIGAPGAVSCYTTFQPDHPEPCLAARDTPAHWKREWRPLLHTPQTGRVFHLSGSSEVPVSGVME